MGHGDGSERSGHTASAVPSPRDPVDEAINQAGEALSQLVDARLWARSDSQARATLAAAARLKALAEAFYLTAVRDLDTRPDAVAGARAGDVAKTFLLHRLRVAPGQAGRDVAAARAIDPDTGTAPELGRALARGQASREHLDVAVRALRKVPAHLLTQVGPQGRTGAQVIDELLTEHAKTFAPHTTENLARQLLHALAPERTDRFDPHAYTRRTFTCVTDSTGMLVGRLQLDPAAAAIVKAGLQTFARPAPVTTATTPDGQETLITDDRNTGQRNADALVTAFRIALHRTGTHTTPATPGTATSPATQVMVIATPDQLAQAFRAQPAPDPTPATPTPTTPSPDPATPRDPATNPEDSPGMADCLHTGPLDPATFARLACDAAVQTVFTTHSGAVLNLGRTVRTVSTAQRKALLARDRGCIVPGCNTPIAACDAHHARWWRNGGSTDITNLALVCAHHHTGIHTGIWSLTIINDLPWVIPPQWIDHLQRPIRNQLPDTQEHTRRTGQQLRLWHDPPHHPDG